MNWMGKLSVGPRSGLAELARRTEVKQTGVTLLVGPDLDNPTKDRVHVGEGDNVLTRLLTHVGDETEDFWTRTVAVTSKDENLTKAHVRYLESRLVKATSASNQAFLSLR